MKKMIIASLLAMVMLFSFAACSGGNEDKKTDDGGNTSSVDGDVVGGYTEERDVTSEDMAIFEEVMGNITGVGYEPLRVSTQVVEGTNYKFYCQTVSVDPEAEEGYAYVTIFEPLEGASPSLVDIEEIK